MTDHNMRILWTSNIVLPAVAPDLGLPQSPFGGWLTLMTGQLARHGGFDIGIAMRAPVPELRRIDKDGISYFAVPQNRRDKFDVTQAACDTVLRDFAPDILHVEGAEMRHARRFLSTWDGPRLLSMQGVLHGYAAYETGRLPIMRMLNPLRPRDALAALALLANRQLRFMPRLAHEREAMGLATHVMGRTLWDRAQAEALAPAAQYYHCPRILRDIFYDMDRNRAETEPHSIFIGNGASPRKGAHVVLEAMTLLKRDFPNIRLYIAGDDPEHRPITSIKRHVGYPSYLRRQITRLGLETNVTFTGVLPEADMAARMARSHVFVMASIIENSPNTLGEAMMLGVPVVSAYTGGAPSMAADEREAIFYRPDDPAMLAHQIRRVFNDPATAETRAQAARARALDTHDPAQNLGALVAAYGDIMQGGTPADG